MCCLTRFTLRVSEIAALPQRDSCCARARLRCMQRSEIENAAVGGKRAPCIGGDSTLAQGKRAVSRAHPWVPRKKKKESPAALAGRRRRLAEKRPLPFTRQRPLIRFVSQCALLATCLGVSARSPTAASSQTSQGKQAQSSRGGLGDRLRLNADNRMVVRLGFIINFKSITI